MAEAENIPNAQPSPQPEKPVRRSWWRRLLRIFFWTGGIFTFLIVVLLILTYIYQDKVKAYVISEINNRVNSELIIKPENVDITIIKTFPDVTVIVKDIIALDAVTAEKKDTLLKAEKFSVGFNIMDLFHGNYSIHNIHLENGKINIWVNEKGKDNYHFLKESTDTTRSDTSHVEFALDKISLQNMACSYSDKRSKSIYKTDFKKLIFTGDFGKENYDFGTEADFTIDKIQSGKTVYFKNSPGSVDIEIGINNKTGQYTVSKGKLKIEELAIDVSGTVLENKKSYTMDLAVKGDEIDLPSALSLLPESFSKNTKELSSTGEFYIDGTVKGVLNDSLVPDVITKFGIKEGATLKSKDGKVELTNIVLDGIFSNAKGNDGLQINSFKASSSKSNFSGTFLLKNFKRPHYETKLSGHIDVSEMQTLLAIDTIEQASGTIDLAFSASGSPAKGNRLTVKDFRSFQTNGTVKFTSGLLKLKGAAFPYDSLNGKLSFDGNNVTAEGFTARAGNSDLAVNGSVKNLLGYLFTDKEALDVTGDLASKNLDLDALLNSEKDKEEKSSDSAYRLTLPKRLRLSLNSEIAKVKFRRFEADDVSGKLQLNNQRLICDPVSFRSMNGTFSGSGMIDGTQDDSLLITCNADIKRVSIYKLFYECENFGEGEGDSVTISYMNFSKTGNLDSRINFASVWSNELSIDENKIYANADITVTNGELLNFKPLYYLSRFIKLDDLKDIHFKDLQNTIEIKNRVIHIPKMQINSSALNVTMSGTHSFSDTVDYHFVVDMNEIRAKKAKAAKPQNTEFGVEEDDGGHRTRIFISMQGYIDNPDIKYEFKDAMHAIKDDLHQEKQNLKSILQDEFHWLKKDSSNSGNKNEDRKKEETGKFILQQDDTPKDKKKKGDDNLDDGDDYK
jgi:hypothetical protein